MLDWPLTVTRVVNPELSGNTDVGVGVGVGVGVVVIVDVGSAVGARETAGWVVVTEVTELPDGEDCVQPVTRMKKIREITRSNGIFIL